MKTGMQFTIAQPACRICSVYHFVASSEPTGRKLTTTSVPVSWRIRTTSSVSPLALSTTSEMYLPSPSCVMPRDTVTPIFGTSANLYVSFGCAQHPRGGLFAAFVGGDAKPPRNRVVGAGVPPGAEGHRPGDNPPRR